MFVANFVGEREILFLDGIIDSGPTGLRFAMRDLTLPLRASPLNFESVRGRPIKLGCGPRPSSWWRRAILPGLKRASSRPSSQDPT